MKILQIITSLRTGGAERLVVDLSKRMAAEGDEVDVLLFDGTRTALYDELEAADIAVYSLGFGEKVMHNPFLIFSLSSFLRKHRFDIIHTHNTPCQLLTALSPAARKTPLVTTEHNTTNLRRGNRLFRYLDRWMYARYRKIVCVGEETARNLGKWLDSPAIEEHTSVIRNGIDLARIQNATPAPDVAAFPGIKLLMVSAFRPQKDQLSLVKAMKYLPSEFRLFLAGGAELPEHKSLMEHCRKTADNLELADRVVFLGIRNDIPRLLASADFIILSTPHEGMPISLIEAMASGRPVLASDVAGVREFAPSREALFPEGDSQLIAGKIAFLAKNPDISRLICERGIDTARKYDIALTADAYRQLYAYLLKD